MIVPPATLFKCVTNSVLNLTTKIGSPSSLGPKFKIMKSSCKFDKDTPLIAPIKIFLSTVVPSLVVTTIYKALEDNTTNLGLGFEVLPNLDIIISALELKTQLSFLCNPQTFLNISPVGLSPFKSK